MKIITISELRKRNIRNGGCFFDPDKLRSDGDTLKSFRLDDSPDNPDIVILQRKNGVGTKWYFNKYSGRVMGAFEA